MTEIQKLEAYHKHLCANAHMINQSIQSWEVIHNASNAAWSTNSDVMISGIKDIQSYYYEKLKESFVTINGNIDKLVPGFKITPVMSYNQWYRSKQLDKII